MKRLLSTLILLTLASSSYAFGGASNKFEGKWSGTLLQCKENTSMTLAVSKKGNEKLSIHYNAKGGAQTISYVGNINNKGVFSLKNTNSKNTFVTHGVATLVNHGENLKYKAKILCPGAKPSNVQGSMKKLS